MSRQSNWMAVGMCALWGSAAIYGQRALERIDRGVVAVRASAIQNYIGWRLFATDSSHIAFNVYRTSSGGTIRLNGTPIADSTDYVDSSASSAVDNTYFVKPVLNGEELAASETYTLKAGASVQQYLDVPIQPPPNGTASCANGTVTSAYTYNTTDSATGLGNGANDASIGDLDGDGQYEIVLKWDPSNSQDNANSGCTGPTYLDAYKLDGTLLWRIDLGPNIRSGAHYTQFLVYDFDGDGKAEAMVKTADGTVDGTGTVIGDGSAHYANAGGFIITGPEYLTVFAGPTGKAVATADYVPGRGTVTGWGKASDQTNRVDRFLGAVAYLDGKRPSAVMCRGYYGRTALTAWDYRDGQLTRRWAFDTDANGLAEYTGQGNHNLSVADVDGDGTDEVVYGSAVIGSDGTGRFSTGYGHGDAMHVSRFLPDVTTDPLVFKCLESSTAYNWILYNARTGDLVKGFGTAGGDAGRAMTSPVDSTYKGTYFWGGKTAGIFDAAGTQKSTRSPAMNFALWWDSDLMREQFDGAAASRYVPAVTKVTGDLAASTAVLTATGCITNNGTKANPVFLGDILGDWREEFICRTPDNAHLRIYLNPVENTTRMPTLLQDPQYRLALAWQNVAYNQPPWPGFYLGPGMDRPPEANIVTAASAGVTLSASISKSGRKAARVWTYRITNLSKTVAQKVEINSLTFAQTGGTACTPVVLPAPPAYPPAFPVVVGDVAAGATGHGAVTIDFTGCGAGARFTVTTAISANAGPAAPLTHVTGPR